MDQELSKQQSRSSDGGSSGRAKADASLANALKRRIDPSDDDALGAAPLHRGLIEPSLLLNIWRAHCPPDLPCVLLDCEFEAQAVMLTAPG